MPTTLLEAQDFTRARARLNGHVHVTPLLSATALGARAGVRLFLKCENLQKTGSFKVRGALNKLKQLDAALRARGVVSVSAGNHAQALAWAARATQTACTVVMPERATPSKVAASRGYGAEVVLHGDALHAFERAHALAAERGLTFIHPFDDAQIMAGQGTAGLELLEQAGSADALIVPIGGGGLIGGIAAAVRDIDRAIRVYGVEPEGAAAMRRSLDVGRPEHLERVETIADGLGAPMAGELTFEVVRRYVEDVVLVTDDEIRLAMAALLSRAKLLTEPAGAAGVAALLAGKIPIKAGERVVVVLSGGNVTMEQLRAYLDGVGE